MAVIETKVIGATAGASGAVVVANFVLWLIGTYGSAEAASASAVVAFVNFVVAGAGAFVVGYLSRHTPLRDVIGDLPDWPDEPEPDLWEGETPAAGDTDPPGRAL